LFAVGDDWQSIYRFTGADITLTTRFQDHFGHTRLVALDRTFRFNNQLSDFTSTFVTQNTAQVPKTLHTVTTTDAPAITLVQDEPHENAPAIEQCLDDIRARAKGHASVHCIGRYRASRPTILEEYPHRFPGLTCRYDTAHRSKGREAEYIIVLDANDERRGWPSQVKDDLLLRLVLPPEEPYPFAEERRLFYVAVTRARYHTYVLSDVSAPSAFVRDMLDGRHQIYRFDHWVTEGGRQRQASLVRCARCGGWFERKSFPSSEFYACRNYPYCEEHASRCEECRTRSLVRQTHN
jgi:DNA helicase IV